MEQDQLKTLIKSCIKILLNEGLLGLNKKDLDNIVRIRYIQGVTDEEHEKLMRSNKQMLYRLIKTQYPWMLEYQYPSKQEGSVGGLFAPFAQFFTNLNYGDEDFLHNFCRQIIRERSDASADLHKNIPNFERDLDKVYDYAAQLIQRDAKNGLYQKNYPLFVSLYMHSKQYGGPEEGGWDYTRTDFIQSIPVNSFQEARNAAIKLLKSHREISGLSSDSVSIYLEKRQGSLQTKQRPHYS